MIQLFVAIDLICLFVLVKVCLKYKSNIKTIAMAISIFLCLYSIISGFYFCADQFSFVRVLVSMAVFLLPCACYLGVKRRAVFTRNECTFREDMLPAILALITIVLTFSKFELFCTGQDQGLYQAEAIELYMGNYEVQHDFEEYQILKNDEDRERYYQMLDETMLGYYPLSGDEYSPEGKVEAISEVSGMYHGVQTFPALLGLGAKIFGLSNMVQMQTIFFVCAVLLLYYTGMNLGFSIGINISSTMLMMLSPLVLWISKSSFTEMFLTMLMAMYLLILTESTKKKQFLAVLPLVAFSFVHVSFLIIYPIFIVINLIQYLQKSQREYLLSNLFLSIGLMFGYSMMSTIAPEYFYMNCGKLYLGNIITKYNLIYWIYFFAIIMSCISVLMFFVKKTKKMYQQILRIGAYFPIINIVVIGIIIYIASKISFYHSTMYALAMATGFLALPYLLYNMICNNHILLENDNFFNIYLLFLYCVMFQFAFFRTEVPFYYYYSRYITFYIPIVVLLTGTFLRNSSKIFRGILIGFSCCCMLLFDWTLLTQKDDTMLEWETLLDLDNVIEERSAIILGSSEMEMIAAAPVRAVTSSSVFPLFEDVKAEVELLKENYTNIYFLTYTSLDDVEEFRNMEFEIVYRDRYTFWRNPNDPSVGIYPLNIAHEEREIILYRYRADGVSNYVDIKNKMVGVQCSIKEDGHILSDGREGVVMFGPYINMEQGDYYAKIPIEILKQTQKTLGMCSVYSGDNIILQKTDLGKYLRSENGQKYLKIPFRLDEDTKEVEVVVYASEGSRFQLYSYEICYADK